MQLIDGKAISMQIKQEIAAEVAEIKAKGGKVPHLAVIIVGLHITYFGIFISSNAMFQYSSGMFFQSFIPVSCS